MWKREGSGRSEEEKVSVSAIIALVRFSMEANFTLPVRALANNAIIGITCIICHLSCIH